MRNPFRRRGGDAGFLERSMFSVMGPPQLGENKVRDGYVPDAGADICGKCGQHWNDHERVHTSSRTYLTCPVSTGVPRGE